MHLPFDIKWPMRDFFILFSPTWGNTESISRRSKSVVSEVGDVHISAFVHHFTLSVKNENNVKKRNLEHLLVYIIKTPAYVDVIMHFTNRYQA